MARGMVEGGFAGKVRRAAMMAPVLLAMGVALASCGFSPMYAERAGSEAVASWEQVDVAPPSGRLAQLVYQELQQNRPPSQAGGRPYELKYSVKEDKASLLGSRLERVRLWADFSLVERSSGRVLLQGKTFGDASYEKTRQHFADDRARDGARRMAAKLVAQDMRTRVAAFLARGMPASAMPAVVQAGTRPAR